MERYIRRYEISEVSPYINWVYFFHAWQVGEREERERLRQEAEDIIKEIEGKYYTHALVCLGDAWSDGDDIVVEGNKIPMLRQQEVKGRGAACLCLADYIKPKGRGEKDKIGLFATSTDIGLEKDNQKDCYMGIMLQIIADRLAEATTEVIHKEVRTTLWGYSPDEDLSLEDLFMERFQGIRPAVGYPSIPDTSINFVLDQIIGMGDIGIRLTESGAMRPHASVSGLMISHPKARYFSIGKIGEDQLEDYAKRRGMPVELMRRFLGGVLREGKII